MHGWMDGWIAKQVDNIYIYTYIYTYTHIRFLVQLILQLFVCQFVQVYFYLYSFVYIFLHNMLLLYYTIPMQYGIFKTQTNSNYPPKINTSNPKPKTPSPELETLNPSQPSCGPCPIAALISKVALAAALNSSRSGSRVQGSGLGLQGLGGSSPYNLQPQALHPQP